MEIVKYVILKFADRRFDLDNAGNTCLHYAAQEGQLAVVKYLIEECGFNPNLANKVGCCVCVHSVCCFHIQCCMYLTLCDVSQSGVHVIVVSFLGGLDQIQTLSSN